MTGDPVGAARGERTEATGIEAAAGAPGGAGAVQREGQTFTGQTLASRYASFVKLPHTLFALPFAGVGVILASYTHAVTALDLVWVVVAFTGARFAAMGFNRLADREYDRRNPRTTTRELPAGRLTVRQAVAAVVVAAVVFMAASWQLNALVGWLSPVALAWVLLYSYTKRFTTLAHLVLGLGLGIAPVGALLAVTGAWPAEWWGPVVLAGAVMFWVAGFDIVYALQDVEFDRTERLYSIPARLGVRRARVVARLMHLASVVLFFAVWATASFPVGWLYLIGVFVMAVVLHVEHMLLGAVDERAPTPAAIDLSFFHANVGVSTSFFVFSLLDRLIG